MARMKSRRRSHSSPKYKGGSPIVWLAAVLIAAGAGYAFWPGGGPGGAAGKSNFD